jgi:hypothetical protein
MNALKHGNYSAAALQADREHRQMMREHRQIFNEYLQATQEYLDLVSQHEYEEVFENYLNK